jgi:hypothetical protein
MRKKPNNPKTPTTDKRRKAKKKKYKVRNWSAYNKMLVERGRLIFHITKEAIERWEEEEKSGKPGRSRSFSDIAIETALTVQQYFRLPLRAAEGVVSSMLARSGRKCPTYSTLCRRGKTLSVNIRIREAKPHETLHVLLDSSGIKVFGEGEWKVRQHGVSKRRTWKKMHVASSAITGEMLVAVITDNDVHDSEVLPEVLEAIPEMIDQVSTDGGYDTKSCYDAIADRNARAVIVPRRDAKITLHGNRKGKRYARDENLRRIRRIGRRRWKQESKYHLRSRAENNFLRYKTIFGDTVNARTSLNQRTQLLIRAKLLNRFTALGMPKSEVVS